MDDLRSRNNDSLYLKELLSEIEASDHVLISLGIRAEEVIEESTSAADQHQQTSTTGMIFFVRLEVLRELCNAMGENGDLHLGRPSILVGETELLNELSFTFFGDRHIPFPQLPDVVQVERS